MIYFKTRKLSLNTTLKKFTDQEKQKINNMKEKAQSKALITNIQGLLLTISIQFFKIYQNLKLNL